MPIDRQLAPPGSLQPQPHWESPAHEIPAIQDAPPLKDYWRILKKRRGYILGTLCLVLALTALFTARQLPMYEASGKIAINKNDSDILNFKDVNRSNDLVETTDVDTQVKILESDSLAQLTLQRLRSSAQAAKSPIAESRPEVEIDASATGTFERALAVRSIPRTRVIEIHFTSPDPKLAADAVNTLMQTYIEQNIASRFQSTTQASGWLARQLSALQIKVETAQQKLVEYQKKNEIVGVDDNQNIVMTKLGEVNKELTEAEADRIRKEANYRLAQTSSPELLVETGSAGGTLLEKLRSQDVDLRTQLAQLQIQYGPSHPKVREVNEQLKQIAQSAREELAKLSERLRTDYLAAQRKEKMLREELVRQKQEASRITETAIDYNVLKRDADASRQVYEGLLQKLKEAEVAAGLNSTNVRIIDLASVPLRPSRPDKIQNVGVGLFLGLFGGIVAALLVERIDNLVNTPEHVGAISGLATLAIIPHFGQTRIRGLLMGKGDSRELSRERTVVAHSNPDSVEAEAFRALRTAVLLSRPEKAPKIILITSPLPQEGKTTVSVNMATVLAQSGKKVLLIDADLRRPKVHVALQIHSKNGLSSLLTGGASEEDVIFASEQEERLFLLPAGPSAPHPAELLNSPLMDSYLRKWSSVFDYIVLDTPPILAVTDAVALSAKADSLLLVVRSAKTTREVLSQATRLLHNLHVPVTGVVLNAVDLDSPDHYYYYYGGKYRSSYYKAYYHAGN